MSHFVYEAIKNESIDDVKHCFATDEDFTEEGRWTPLHAASRIGNVTIIEVILQYIESTSNLFFDINTEFEIIDMYSDYRGTALTEALLNGHKEAAKLLIKHGASVNATYYSQNSNTPDWQFGCYELATNGGVAWWLADDEIFELCVEHGIYIDATDSNDSTALVYAISAGKPDKVARLLSLGANPDLYINHEYMGSIPLIVYAVQICCDRDTDESFRVVELLLKHGAALSSICADCENESAIDIVLGRHNKKLVSLFGLQNIVERLANSQ